MNRRRILGAAVAALVAVLAGGWGLARVADAPTGADEVPATDRPITAEAIARGAYVARQGDCSGCHTMKGKADYAGGFPTKLPFGTIYASNITPDPIAGIGRWTDAQFIAAMYRGIGGGGRHLYPAMPYSNYTRMPLDDVLALKAYLFSLRPVATPAPRNDVAFPFDQTWAIAYWNLLFNPKQRFRPDPRLSTEINRGAYLVEGPGHCGGCHSPRNLLYAEKSGRHLGGAVVEHLRAYNITGDRTYGIGAWSTDDLVRYLRDGRADGRGVAGGSMSIVVEESTAHLTDPDLRAIAAYLKNTRAKPGAEEIAALPTMSTARGGDRAGRLLYEGACAGCHGLDGAPDPTLDLRRFRSLRDPEGLNAMAAVLKGVDVRTGRGNIHMPAFGARYSDAEIAALVRYLTARGGTGGITARQVSEHRGG